ncbi:LysR family transcriptional regulator [Microbacterium sp. SSW1-49]|uniref:LysR family transcriptional regulator n=1 Tax=Microbacterium croceum TaxID=2851645 RepID=A0ABT0FF00_9MICO|nr:LysR family transcriptional regulator [Microbacterium croceum]MCK2036224.1 LysR family transcriptional regulator [Microbacterium croceum]
MKIALLRRYVVLADTLHFPRAAEQLGIPLASLYTSLDKLEEELGHALIHREGTPRLTPVGELFLEEARTTVAAAPPPAPKTVAPAGGKAKASKGRGRAPIVKGQPKPYKKRQGR